jgi:thiol:disulfide interchange protein DsbG
MMKWKQRSLVAPVLTFALGVLLSGVYFSREFRPQVNQGQALVNSFLARSPVGQQMMVTRSIKDSTGLIGYILARKSLPSQPVGIVYTDPTGTYIINPGTTYNQAGQTLQQIAFTRYIQSKVAENALQTITQTHYITEGQDAAPHKLWIVVDPNCIFCHKTYEDLQPLITDGVVQVRWIVIGMLKPSSEGKAAAILSAPNPLSAFKQNEHTFIARTEEGGITPLENPSESTLKALKANQEFALSLVNVGTPIFLFNGADHLPRLQEGYPGSPQATQALVMTASSTWS